MHSHVLNEEKASGINQIKCWPTGISLSNLYSLLMSIWYLVLFLFFVCNSTDYWHSGCIISFTFEIFFPLLFVIWYQNHNIFTWILFEEMLHIQIQKQSVWQIFPFEIFLNSFGLTQARTVFSSLSPTLCCFFLVLSFAL